MISFAIAKMVIAEMLSIAETGKGAVMAQEIVERRQWQLLQSNSGELDRICEQVVNDNPLPLESYRKGKVGLKQFFVGQVMKVTKGKAKASEVQDLLDKYLNK